MKLTFPHWALRHLLWQKFQPRNILTLHGDLGLVNSFNTQSPWFERRPKSNELVVISIVETMISYAYQFQVIFQRVPLAQSPRCFHAVGIKRFFPLWSLIRITQTQNKISDGVDNDYLGSKAYIGYGWFSIINRFFRLNADIWEWWDLRVIYNHKPDTEAPFTLQKKMGPDTLESSPDQFFLTVYTVSNHVRLSIEKNP